MVIWSHRARGDLKSIYNYIKLDSPINAKKVIQDVYNKVGLLDKAPRIGKIVADINDSSWREISVHSWGVIYHLHNDIISIVAVVHKRKLLDADALDA